MSKIKAVMDNPVKTGSMIVYAFIGFIIFGVLTFGLFKALLFSIFTLPKQNNEKITTVEKTAERNSIDIDYMKDGLAEQKKDIKDIKKGIMEIVKALK